MRLAAMESTVARPQEALAAAWKNSATSSNLLVNLPRGSDIVAVGRPGGVPAGPAVPHARRRVGELSSFGQKTGTKGRANGDFGLGSGIDSRFGTPAIWHWSRIVITQSLSIPWARGRGFAARRSREVLKVLGRSHVDSEDRVMLFGSVWIFTGMRTEGIRANT